MRDVVVLLDASGIVSAVNVNMKDYKCCAAACDDAMRVNCA
jgi:hypothetical protein